MEKIKFTTSLPPTLNHIRYNNHTKTKEAKDWIIQCQCMCVMAMRRDNLFCEDIHKGKFCITVNMFVKRDRDIDSSVKLLLDALEGIVYKNDKQVVDLNISKYKSDNPRLEIEIYEKV